MKNPAHHTGLTKAQAEYLNSKVEMPDELRRVLAGKPPFALTEAQRELLMERVASRLQERGFDRDYRPTDEGRQLEGIIDALKTT